MNKIEKVFPTEEELSLVSSHVRCSEENCSAVFKSTSNLNMHLIRHHKVSGEELCKKDGVRQFYCPAQLCVYNGDSKKFFTKLKYLKQHFLKVHAVKNFICNKCDKKFATQAFQKMHEKTCGSSFNCSCGFVYNSIEALLTHCRRKGHASLNSNTGKCEKLNVIKDSCDKSENLLKSETLLKKSERLICPKLSPDISYPIHHIAAIALSELSTACRISRVVDKGIQTEFNKSVSVRSSRKNINHSKTERKQNSSQETQTTGRCKNTKINTETQTNNEYLKKGRSLSKLTFPKKRKKSMETQTKELLYSMSPKDKNATHGNEHLCKGLGEDSEKSSKFFGSEILGVDNLFQDVSSEFLKDSSNLSNESNSCAQLTDLNSISTKSYINKDELLNKRTKMNLLPDGSDKQDLFDGNTDLNICSKEFEPDLNELNMSCKKLSGESEGLDLMESGSYNVFDINKLCNIETQTEIDVFLTECNDDSPFTLCSTTETQTIDFDPLLYSNMCTQTPDEVNQLFGFNFVDIETQTAWPDL